MKSSKLRHAVEAVFTLLLFTLQNIVLVGPFISTMFTPLFAYLVSLKIFYPYLEREINVLLFSEQFILGRIIAVIGFLIFLCAAIQFLKGRKGLVKTGFYSVVRHPQYTGIVVIALGLTAMCLTLTSQPQIVFMWLIQVLGYIALARYEEWHLEKKYGENYLQYKRNVPFIFPLRCPSKVSETLFTISISVIIAFSLLLVPLNFLRFQLL